MAGIFIIIGRQSKCDLFDISALPNKSLNAIFHLLPTDDSRIVIKYHKIINLFIFKCCEDTRGTFSQQRQFLKSLRIGSIIYLSIWLMLTKWMNFQNRTMHNMETLRCHLDDIGTLIFMGSKIASQCFDYTIKCFMPTQSFFQTRNRVFVLKRKILNSVLISLSLTKHMLTFVCSW